MIGGIFGLVLSQPKLRVRWQAEVRFAYFAYISLAGCVLALGLAGLCTGQPRAVWYGLLLPGLVCTSSFGAIGPRLLGLLNRADRVTASIR